MKKTFRNFLGVCVVLLVLFNVIAFVAIGWSGQEKYTASFWIGYAGITLCLIAHAFCGWYVLREKTPQEHFYNSSLLRISYHGLIWSFVIGGACMLISPLPYWVGTILCAIVLAVTVIAGLKAAAAIDLVEKTDETVKVQTEFIRLLTADAENLTANAKTDCAKAACKKVYEAARYSDPMRRDALSAVEEQISEQMEVLTKAVAEGNEEKISTIAEEIVVLIGERNRKCKVLK